MISIKKRYLSIIAVILLSLLQFINCSQDYNPFRDYSLAKVEISGELKTGDTVEMYSPEKVTLTLVVPNLINKITVRTEKNIFFSDSVFDSRNFDLKSIVHCEFQVCFYDTGTNCIKIEIERKNGEITDNEMKLYIRQPLSQKPVEGKLGSKLHLETKPVKYRNVMYNWKFGNLYTMHSDTNVVNTVIKAQNDTGVGEVWVTDFDGRFKSPSVKFRYSFLDTTPPLIVCANTGLDIKNDTIFTSQKNFDFCVKVTDDGSEKLDVKVNNSSFQREDYPFYWKSISEIDTANDPVLLHVVACDKSNLCSEKNYYVKYDSTAAAEKSRVVLIIDAPGKDSIESTRKTYSVHGRISTSTNVKVNAKIRIVLNGNTLKETPPFPLSYHESNWTFDVNLINGMNSIRIIASDLNDSLLAEDTTMLLYDGDCKDINPPCIVNITVNDITVLHGNNTSEVTALRSPDKNEMKIIAFDDGSGVDSVIVNGRDITHNTRDSSFLWIDSISVIHDSVRSFRIRIIDSLHIERDTVIKLVYNHIPVMDTADEQITAHAGQLCKYKLSMTDEDFDDLVFEKIDGPANLQIGKNDGLILWTPKNSDTGLIGLKVRISDMYESSVQILEISVKPAYSKVFSFITDEKDFPEVVESGTPVNVQIRIDSASGKPPFRYQSAANNQQMKPLVNGIFSWVPKENDTGLCRFTIKAKDWDGWEASLHPVIRVIKKIDSKKIELKWTGDITKSGFLDCTVDRSFPDTLKVIVSDPYLKYRNMMVSSRCGENSTPSVVVDSAGVVNIVINRDRFLTDSIVVMLKDTLGNELTLKKMIDFGSPRPISILDPLNNSQFFDSTVDFRWSRCTDDKNTEYQLWISKVKTMSPHTVNKVKDTSFKYSCDNGGVYYAQAVCIVDTMIIRSQIVLFNVVRKGDLTASFGSQYIPTEMVAEKDTLQLNIVAQNNVGPLEFSIINNYNGQCTVDGNGVLSFKPITPGIASISVAVKDSSGQNTYLLLNEITVKSKNSPCSLTVFPSIGSEIKLVQEPIELNFKIEDSDLFSDELYNVNVKMFGVSNVITVDSTKKFTIKIDPAFAETTLDTLCVSVSDAGGYSDTVFVLLRKEGESSLEVKYKFPENYKEVSETTVTFEWYPAGSAPDLVTYDFYIYDISGVTQVYSKPGMTGTTERVDNLEGGKNYTWYVIAHQGSDEATGEVQYFSVATQE